ncbi:hypothetical protein T484DRAFT_1938245 [Baffinella frigidus]|nr:hypothetical protein T484DRAFT_1938245 [Cryptophyta sp. CCMP2293]
MLFAIVPVRSLLPASPVAREGIAQCIRLVRRPSKFSGHFWGAMRRRRGGIAVLIGSLCGEQLNALASSYTGFGGQTFTGATGACPTAVFSRACAGCVWCRALFSQGGQLMLYYERWLILHPIPGFPPTGGFDIVDSFNAPTTNTIPIDTAYGGG